jgi:hypothetical protein
LKYEIATLPSVARNDTFIFSIISESDNQLVSINNALCEKTLFLDDVLNYYDEIRCPQR